MTSRVPEATQLPGAPSCPGRGSGEGGRLGRSTPAAGANFQKTRRPRPRPPCAVGGGGSGGGAAAGRWLRPLLQPPPRSRRPPQLPPARSPVQPLCPGARPRPGSPAHRVISFRARRRQRRAQTQRWATRCTGPCQVRRGSLPGRQALGSSSPQGTRWVTSGEPPPAPLGALGSQRAGVPAASRTPDPGSARAPRLGFALREGGYRVLVTLGTPVLVLPALARCAKGPLGRCRAPPRLCSSPRALRREPGAPRGVTGAGLPRASDGQKPPIVPRLQLLRMGVGVLAGVPQFPAAQRPRGTCCLGLTMFPPAPWLRPPLVSAQLGASL